MAKRSVLLPVLVLISLSVTLLSHAELLSDRRTMPASARLIDASWNHVFAMAFDGQTMWVSTPLGLKRYDVASLAFQRYPLDKDLLVSSVRDIAVGSDGAVWFATSAGLGRYQLGGWTIYHCQWQPAL